MGRTRSTHGETIIAFIISENLNARDHLGDLGVDGTIILKWKFNNRI
jgi:hypothetical protein